jgi:hypothetical protein
MLPDASVVDFDIFAESEAGATACRIRDLPTQSPSASTPLRLCSAARSPSRAATEMSPS